MGCKDGEADNTYIWPALPNDSKCDPGEKTGKRYIRIVSSVYRLYVKMVRLIKVVFGLHYLKTQNVILEKKERKY